MGINRESFEKLRNYIAMCAMQTGAQVVDIQVHLNVMEETLQQRCGAALDWLAEQERLRILTAELAGKGDAPTEPTEVNSTG